MYIITTPQKQVKHTTYFALLYLMKGFQIRWMNENKIAVNHSNYNRVKDLGKVYGDSS